MKISHFLFLAGIISANYCQVALGRRLGDDVAPMGKKTRERKRGQNFRFVSESPSYEGWVLVPEEQVTTPTNPVNAEFWPSYLPTSTQESWYWDGEKIRSAYIEGWCLAVYGLSTPTIKGVAVKQCNLGGTGIADQFEKWKYDPGTKLLYSRAYSEEWCITVGGQMPPPPSDKIFNAVLTLYDIANDDQILKQVQL